MWCEAKRTIEGPAGAQQRSVRRQVVDVRGLDGMTAGSILKGDPVTSGLKIIALTSFIMHGDQGKILAAGFDGYLSMPISTRELPGLINLWLGVEGQ